jgi:hypothetical protein
VNDARPWRFRHRRYSRGECRSHFSLDFFKRRIDFFLRSDAASEA